MTTGRALMLLMLGVFATGCASSGGVPRPFPGAELPPGSGQPPSTEPTTTTRSAQTVAPLSSVLAGALALQGVPYVNGGTTPAGFDCSGLVQYVFAQQGVAVPRDVHDQYRVGRNVDRQHLQPGDLIFFQTVSRGASHVGIVVDDTRFVHAPSSRGVVRIERFTIPYWATRYVGARRIEATAD